VRVYIYARKLGSWPYRPTYISLKDTENRIELDEALKHPERMYSPEMWYMTLDDGQTRILETHRQKWDKCGWFKLIGHSETGTVADTYLDGDYDIINIANG